MVGTSGGQVRFGPAGWSYPDWNGPVFGGRREDGLGLLSTVFDVVEINTTFYRPPARTTAQGWLRKVSHNPAFLFTAKLWQGFTHQREFRPADVTEFRRGIAPLVEAGRLEALLLQFPWSFRYGAAEWDHLERLFRAFPDVQRVVEVRHRSWDRPAVLAALREENVGFCSVDQPLARGSLEPTAHVTADVAYVRLHGRNAQAWFRRGAGRDERYNYRYSLDELGPWIARIRILAAKASRVIVVTNNHFGGSAVFNAAELRHLWDGSPVQVPERWLAACPELDSLARPLAPEQPSLFS